MKRGDDVNLILASGPGAEIINQASDLRHVVLHHRTVLRREEGRDRGLDLRGGSDGLTVGSEPSEPHHDAPGQRYADRPEREQAGNPAESRPNRADQAREPEDQRQVEMGRVMPPEIARDGHPLDERDHPEEAEKAGRRPVHSPGGHSERVAEGREQAGQEAKLCGEPSGRNPDGHLKRPIRRVGVPHQQVPQEGWSDQGQRRHHHDADQRDVRRLSAAARG